MDAAPPANTDRSAGEDAIVLLPRQVWLSTALGKLYVLLVLAAAIWVAISALTARPEVDLLHWLAPTYSPPAWAIVIWVSSIVVLVAAPSYPPLAVFIYIGLLIGIPRYHSHFAYMVYQGILECVSVLGLAALLIYRLHERPAGATFRSPHARVMLALGLWVAICLVANFIKGRPWKPWLSHHPINMANAVAIFLIATHMQAKKVEALLMGLGLACVLIIRATFSPYSIYRDGDVAAMLVMVMPLALIGFTSGYQPRWLGRSRVLVGGIMIAVVLAMLEWVNYSTEHRVIPQFSRPVETLKTFTFAAATVLIVALSPLRWRLPAFTVAVILNLLRLLYFVQNRGAGLAFVAVVLVLIVQSRWWWLYLLTIAAVAGATLPVFLKSEYWERYRHAMEGGGDQASGLERLEIWKAGWVMIKREPVFGVGPGNYANEMFNVTTNLGGKVAHNSFINMFAETGFPGGLLYTALIVMTAWTLWRVSRRTRLGWPGPAARVTQAALVAYVVVGMFITRHDLVLAYALMGWAVALRRFLTIDRPVEAPVSTKAHISRHLGLIAPMTKRSR